MKARNNPIKLQCITRKKCGYSSIVFIGTKTECRKEYKTLIKKGELAWDFWLWYSSVEAAVNQIKQESALRALSN